MSEAEWQTRAVKAEAELSLMKAKRCGHCLGEPDTQLVELLNINVCTDCYEVLSEHFAEVFLKEKK